MSLAALMDGCRVQRKHCEPLSEGNLQACMQSLGLERSSTDGTLRKLVVTQGSLVRRVRLSGKPSCGSDTSMLRYTHMS